MSERRFVLVDFTHMNSVGCLRVYEAGKTYTLPRGVTHAAAKRVKNFDRERALLTQEFVEFCFMHAGETANLKLTFHLDHSGGG
jgi:hypothetical protein